MKAKLLSMLLAASMVGAMMAGCGSKTETTDATTTNTTTEVVTEAETDATDAVTEATTQTTEAVETTEAADAAEGVAIAVGTYAGSYTKEAMGSEVVYEYTLTLNEDNTYAYHVSFEMGGTEYPEDEAGTYAVEGTTVTLTPEAPLKELDATITVTSTETGKINFARCVSSFASAQVELEAVLAE